MSTKVELEKLLEVAAGFGTTPMLLTTDDDGRPRASAVVVAWAGDVATVRAGHRSVANAQVRPLVSLLWPAPVGERFALLVDGEVTAATPDEPPADVSPTSRAARPGGFVTIRATSAILHVVAGKPTGSGTPAVSPAVRPAVSPPGAG